SYWFVEQDSRGAPKAKAKLEPLSDTVCRDYERSPFPLQPLLQDSPHYIISHTLTLLL
ncbi:hypothetical protein GBAR_LOCUS12286, partial [Geodia barretti]